MNNNKVSVLMPVARGSHTIVNAVKSILDCDLAGKEEVEIVIAPDDGSHAYAEVLEGFPHCAVLEPTWFQGSGAGRNRAFAASRGAWITIVDADDTVFPGYLDILRDVS